MKGKTEMKLEVELKLNQEVKQILNELIAALKAAGTQTEQTGTDATPPKKVPAKPKETPQPADEVVAQSPRHELTYDDLVAVCRAHPSRKEVVALLMQHFGHSSITELAPEKYWDFVDVLKAAASAAKKSQ